MQNGVRPGYWTALALVAVLGSTPECRAQFAAASEPPEDESAQASSPNGPVVAPRRASGVPTVAAQPTRILQGSNRAARAGSGQTPELSADLDARDGNRDAAALGNGSGRALPGADGPRSGAAGAPQSRLGSAGGASAADVERGYDRAVVMPDNGNGGPTGGSGRNSAGDGNLGASAGLLNSAAGLGGNSNGGSGSNSAQGGTNSGSTGIEGALNSFGGASGGRSENANGNGNRRSNGGPAENGNAGGGRDTTGGSARNLPARGNSGGSGSDRSVDRNQNEAPANNSGREAPNSQKDKSGADSEDRSASNDSNANDNGGSDRSNRDAPPEGNSDGAAKAGAPDRPEEEGWSAGSDPVGQAAARRRFGDLGAGAAGRDLLGEKRDAEAVDAEDALHRIGDRIDPLTGAVGIEAPVAGGVSPLLRAVVETAKKRKQKK